MNKTESPSYNALQEWLDYEMEYMAEHPEYKFREDYRRPDEYEPYRCYSPEMVNKVDELCNKYDRGLPTDNAFLEQICDDFELK